MLGDGFVQLEARLVEPVLAPPVRHRHDGRGPRRSSASPLNSRASSPIVSPCRIGIGRYPVYAALPPRPASGPRRRSRRSDSAGRARRPGASARRLFHHVRDRRRVGVEARADVLQIDDDRVEPLEHRRRSDAPCRRRASRSAGRCVSSRDDGTVGVELPADAVLGAEQRDERARPRAARADRSCSRPAASGRSGSSAGRRACRAGARSSRREHVDAGERRRTARATQAAARLGAAGIAV